MNKLIPIDSSRRFFSNLKSKGNKIVFTNGCFDLLHPGHIDYLERAKKLGDLLVIGLNEDDSIKILKGNQRPINNLNFRSTMLAALNSVDFIVPFKEETPANLIQEIEPQVLVKGGDYTIDNIVGAEFVQQTGGEVLVIPFLDGYSSSSIISKIQSLK